MPLEFLEVDGLPLTDLSLLSGMPLTHLQISFTQVSDLSPLNGMPLTDLRFQSTNVTDLSPLKDMPLKILCCDFKPERDTELLRSIKTLETINGKPAAEFWKEVEEQAEGEEALSGCRRRKGTPALQHPLRQPFCGRHAVRLASVPAVGRVVFHLWH